eukprot:2132851-Amphidinium_carterae.1
MATNVLEHALLGRSISHASRRGCTAHKTCVGLHVRWAYCASLHLVEMDVLRIMRIDEALAFRKKTVGTAPDEGTLGKLTKEASGRSDSALEATKSWTEYSKEVQEAKIPNFLKQAHHTRKVMADEHGGRLATDAINILKQALDDHDPG